MRNRGWVGACGGHLFRHMRQRQSPRCVCGEAITKQDGFACRNCYALIPRELLDELHRHPKGSDARIAAEAAIENFLRCERANTNEVKS
jgi:hypothetical protein